MIKITNITIQKPYHLICEFNHKEIRSLDVLPIIQGHVHLKGVDQLLDESVFGTVSIGEFGEIVWKNIVSNTYNGVETIWDYDISPEYAYSNSSDLLEVV